MGQDLRGVPARVGHIHGAQLAQADAVSRHVSAPWTFHREKWIVSGREASGGESSRVTTAIRRIHGRHDLALIGEHFGARLERGLRHNAVLTRWAFQTLAVRCIAHVEV